MDKNKNILDKMSLLKKSLGSQKIIRKVNYKTDVIKSFLYFTFDVRKKMKPLKRDYRKVQIQQVMLMLKTIKNDMLKMNCIFMQQGADYKSEEKLNFDEGYLSLVMNRLESTNTLSNEDKKKYNKEKKELDNQRSFSMNVDSTMEECSQKKSDYERKQEELVLKERSLSIQLNLAPYDVMLEKADSVIQECENRIAKLKESSKNEKIDSQAAKNKLYMLERKLKQFNKERELLQDVRMKEKIRLETLVK